MSNPPKSPFAGQGTDAGAPVDPGKGRSCLGWVEGRRHARSIPHEEVVRPARWGLRGCLWGGHGERQVLRPSRSPYPERNKAIFSSIL